MRSAPYLVGGRARLDTDLMSVVDGLVVKEGAEALVCAATFPRGLGVAVRVADGGERATGPLLIEALRQLDAIGVSQIRRLAAHAAPAVLGGGRPVGRLEVDLRLQRT
jgi:L-asparaginase II